MANKRMKMDMEPKYYISYTPHRKGYCHANKDGTAYIRIFFFLYKLIKCRFQWLCLLGHRSWQRGYWIVGLSPTQGMDVCHHHSVLCCPVQTEALR